MNLCYGRYCSEQKLESNRKICKSFMNVIRNSGPYECSITRQLIGLRHHVTNNCDICSKTF